jgi:GH25 family lysozyme M1 (1,4-beta-N-acetylmuramidase)
MNTIRRGSTGPDVVAWQKILGLVPDGDFGPVTETATMEWQRKNEITVDGVVGPQTWAKALTPPGAPAMLRGLDASSVQGALPYASLKEYSFVILKAQQGNDGFDPYFERNMKGAVDAGIEPFAYCFAYPLPHLDPRAQAKLFVDSLARFSEMADRPIFLDYEWPELIASRPGGKGWKEWGCSPPQIAAWLRDNAAEVQRLSGRVPVIYTYDSWWSAVREGAAAYGFATPGDVSWAAQYGLWMAWYREGWPVPGAAPKIPAPWTSWRVWQFDGNKGLRLPNGIDADFCVFNGDAAALARFTRGA